MKESFDIIDHITKWYGRETIGTPANDNIAGENSYHYANDNLDIHINNRIWLERIGEQNHVDTY